MGECGKEQHGQSYSGERFGPWASCLVQLSVHMYIEYIQCFVVEYGNYFMCGTGYFVSLVKEIPYYSNTKH